MMALSAPSQWLANELTSLLSTPHADGISRAPHLDAAPPGPGEDFSSRFDSMFMRHARGLIGEREVDCEELKRSLRALQQKWNPMQCRYENCESLHRRIEGFHVGTAREPSASVCSLVFFPLA